MRVFSKVALMGAVTIMVGVAAGAGMAQEQTGQTAGGLPQGPEAALVEKTCTVCHVASQFTTQHRSRDQWAETVNTMIGYGAPVSDADFDPIVNYLAKNFGAQGGAAQAK